MVNLPVNIGGLQLKNPVTVASGTFGYGREYAEFYDLSSLGAVFVKGVSTVPWLGNPVPRVVETPSGMLNAIGLQNPGLEYFVEVDMPFLRQFDTAVIVNIIGRTIEEYVEVTKRLNDVPGVHAIEINISCPNIKEGGIQFGSSAVEAGRVIAAVKAATSLPVIPKLSPNVTSIAHMAKAAEEAGADAISLVNTFMGMAIDTATRQPILANKVGGLSGPAIRPLAVRMVWDAFAAVNVPLIGMGGIATADDALQFILAGATAVSVGTANFYNPLAPLDVATGIAEYVREHGKRYDELIGAAHDE